MSRIPEALNTKLVISVISEQEQVTPGGIVYGLGIQPVSTKTGVVKSVGPNIDSTSSLINQTVIFNSFSASSITVDNQDYSIVDSKDLLAKL